MGVDGMVEGYEEARQTHNRNAAPGPHLFQHRLHLGILCQSLEQADDGPQLVGVQPLPCVAPLHLLHMLSHHVTVLRAP